jgi:hypothetical protein
VQQAPIINTADGGNGNAPDGGNNGGVTPPEPPEDLGPYPEGADLPADYEPPEIPKWKKVTVEVIMVINHLFGLKHGGPAHPGSPPGTSAPQRPGGG